ncbi:MAG TPA: hypothetical protein VFT61_00295, partial [Sphingomicrobium sp.]|nr:hypothetical protein [Sphingomicrobium sp.]
MAFHSSFPRKRESRCSSRKLDPRFRGGDDYVLAVAVSLFALTLSAAPATAQQRTYINPVDIDYRYNWEQTNSGISYRTGADPAVVRHKGAYYLFETLADGYWRSTDLMHWSFIT